jgi:hypothetical protein
MKIDMQHLYQQAARVGQRIVSAGQDVLAVRHGIKQAVGDVADELMRRSSPARDLPAVADTRAMGARRPVSRRRTW